MRRHLTYANVVSSLCLFVVLGGTSYGLASGSIDSREIKNNIVGTADLRNNDVRSRDIRSNEIRSTDLRDRTLTGRDIALDSLGGNLVDEGDLGQVPRARAADTAANAQALGGLGPAAFATAPVIRTLDLDAGEEATLMTLTGFGTLRVPAGSGGCDTTNEDLTLEWENTSSTTQSVFYARPGEAVGHDEVSPDATSEIDFTGAAHHAQIAVRAGQRSAFVDVFVELEAPGCELVARADLPG